MIKGQTRAAGELDLQRAEAAGRSLRGGGRCGGIGGTLPRGLGSGGRRRGRKCPVRVWEVSGPCLGSLLSPGLCLRSVWEVSGKCLVAWERRKGMARAASAGERKRAKATPALACPPPAETKLTEPRPAGGGADTSPACPCGGKRGSTEGGGADAAPLKQLPHPAAACGRVEAADAERVSRACRRRAGAEGRGACVVGLGGLGGWAW